MTAQISLRMSYLIFVLTVKGKKGARGEMGPKGSRGRPGRPGPAVFFDSEEIVITVKGQKVRSMIVNGAGKTFGNVLICRNTSPRRATGCANLLTACSFSRENRDLSIHL